MAAPRSAPFYELFSSLAADRHFATDVFAKEPLLLEGPALDGVAGALTMEDIDAAVSGSLLKDESNRLFASLIKVENTHTHALAQSLDESKI